MKKKTARGQYWLAIPFALVYTFREPEMCTAGQRVLLTITGPGPSFFLLDPLELSSTVLDFSSGNPRSICLPALLQIVWLCFSSVNIILSALFQPLGLFSPRNIHPRIGQSTKALRTGANRPRRARDRCRRTPRAPPRWQGKPGLRTID